MKKLLMIQPGAFGDIFICAPIAQWYAIKGYKVYWPICKKFESTIKRFDYVTPILLPEATLDSDWLRSDVLKILPMIDYYDKVINLADRGPHSTAQFEWENFESCKYRVAEVPINHKNTLTWSRNIEKEDTLYEELTHNLQNKEYVVAATQSSHNDSADIPALEKRNVIYVTEIEGYDIVDWYKVIKEAKAIYCVESSIQCFIDGALDHFPQDKFLLKRSSIKNESTYTLAKNWNLSHF
jgi:hypothetical protein